jgi:ribosomal-protein-alanine N-acetyltransferase
VEIVSIFGRHVILRPLLESDLNRIYSWRCNTADLFLWFQRPEVLSCEEFIDYFKRFTKNTIHIILMVQSKSKQEPLGMVYTYEPDYLNGYAFLCSYIAPNHRGYLYGAEASLLFTDYIFTYYPFRKLYAEVYEYNTPSLNNVLKSGWKEEGRLKQHRWYSDGYKDMLIFALYRTEFYNRFKKLLSSLKDDPYVLI